LSKASRNEQSDEFKSGKKNAGAAAALKAHMSVIKFVAVTVLSLLAFFLVLRISWVQIHFSRPYTDFVAASSRLFLQLLGIEAHGQGSLISSPQFTVNILYVCNGIEATAIFFATILGFPSSWKNKLVGLMIGYPVIFFINILRIAALFIIGFRIPEIFETVHYYYAQAFVILATIGVWIIWAAKFSQYGSKSPDKATG